MFGGGGGAMFGQTIKDPPLDVQEISGVQEKPSQERSWHRKCVFTVFWCHEKGRREP